MVSISPSTAIRELAQHSARAPQGLPASFFRSARMRRADGSRLEAAAWRARGGLGRDERLRRPPQHPRDSARLSYLSTLRRSVDA